MSLDMSYFWYSDIGLQILPVLLCLATLTIPWCCTGLRKTPILTMSQVPTCSCKHYDSVTIAVIEKQPILQEQMTVARYGTLQMNNCSQI